MNSNLQARYAAAKAKAQREAEATEVAHNARFREMERKLNRMMEVDTMKHRARTTQQIIDAASQGTQFPCGSIADHYRKYGHKHTCWKCEAQRAEMTEAHKQGYRDAQERALLYDTRTLDLEITNSTQAYCDVPAIEPAVSYIVGYTAGLQAIYDSARSARRTA